MVSREIRADRQDDPNESAQGPWHLNELVRARRTREDAGRPLGVNLSEGLALTEFLSTFTGVCRK